MKITKQLPTYYVEGFGTLCVDDSCPDENGKHACCDIVSLMPEITVESSCYFYYDFLGQIEEELNLMHESLSFALFIYMMDGNELNLKYEI